MSHSPEQLRELDAWIAEHVLGFHRFDASMDNHSICRVCGHGYGIKFSHWVPDWQGYSHSLPRYTTDPAAAMMVLEKCARRMNHGIVGIGSPMGESVAFNEKKPIQGWVVGKIGRPDNFEAEADTLPLAICLFAQQLFQDRKGKA